MFSNKISQVLHHFFFLPFLTHSDVELQLVPSINDILLSKTFDKFPLLKVQIRNSEWFYLVSWAQMIWFQRLKDLLVHNYVEGFSEVLVPEESITWSLELAGSYFYR